MNRMARIISVLVVVPLSCLALVIRLNARALPDTSVASPIYVRDDGHDTHCNGTADAAYSVPVSPTCAYATVQKGVSEVDVGGTVVVRSGTYTENVAIAQNLTIQGDGAHTTVVDGNSLGQVLAVNSGLAVTISGVAIRNGYSGYDGGGIAVGNNGAIALESCIITSNTSSAGAGGLYLGSSATAVISNCAIVSNTAYAGGGIASYADMLTIISSTVSSNTATGGSGGGIWQAGTDAALLIVRSTFQGNDAKQDAGAVYELSSPSAPNTVIIQASEFVSNTARNAGAVGHAYSTLMISESVFLRNEAQYYGCIHSSGPLFINDTTLRWNRATTSQGGGLASYNATVLDNVTFAENTAQIWGGAINNQGPMTLTNVTISSNTGKYGGGIYHAGAFTLTVVNSTVVSNASSTGDGAGGIHTEGPVVVRNTILAHNDNDNCLTVSSGTLTSAGHNLEYGDTCGLNATGDMTGTHPYLGPLADNGGSTWTHALSGTSPALDAVPALYCIVPTDQRGVNRPQGTACDIGAYERGQVTLAVTKSVDDDRPDRGQLITFTVRVDNSGIVSATDACVSDTLHLSMTLAGPVILYPPQGGAILAQDQGDLPLLADGLTIGDGACVTLTVPVSVADNAPYTLITNTVVVTSAGVATPWMGSVRLDLHRLQFLPLVMRAY